ncbi:hypothetical protein [Algicella marina]|uniref:SRPBCC family protein n=1 Tax=Algicella marina TaxID=2683284 RepID=A0A6P1SWM6_9RHOB|nr:hypothetical protein [Algicella marina]QHQ33925.1 hypothetical protein GO499_01375 [Algicella marina]
MTKLSGTIEAAETASEIHPRLTDFPHWENLAKSAGLQVTPVGDPPSYSPGQVWNVSGKAGPLPLDTQVTLSNDNPPDYLALETSAHGIAVTLDFRLSPAASGTTLAFNIRLKPKNLAAKAMLVPVDMRRKDFSAKISRLIAKHLKIKAKSS